MKRKSATEVARNFSAVLDARAAGLSGNLRATAHAPNAKGNG